MAACNFKREDADLIIHNAEIYTLNKSDDIFDAIAIRDGKILEVGAEHQILNKYKAPKKIDAQKRAVYPGFIDAHCHYIQYGLNALIPDLSHCTSFDQVLEVLEPYSNSNEEHWLVASGWDQSKWEDSSFPNKTKLDEMFPNRPVFLKRVDLHMGLANQRALDAAGISEEDSYDGSQVTMENGFPTGLIKDGAYNTLINIIPEPSSAELKKAIIKAQDDCFRYGLTSITDAALNHNDVVEIAKFHETGELKMRIVAMLMDDEVNYSHYLESGPFQNDRLSVTSFKYFVDGALGSRGALLSEEYTDDPGNFGLLMYQKDELIEKGLRLKEFGWQMNTHCIGDSAVNVVLDVYEEVLKESNDKRWRIEHAQMIKRNDLDRMRSYDIIPSVQPTHATSDQYWVEDRIGPERMKYSYVYKDMLEYSGMLALGTDFPVEHINPLRTFYSAVFRKSFEEKNGDSFYPNQSIDRKSALKGMTIWAAYSNFEEKKKGSLEKGKFADVVVLDRDIMKVDEKHLSSANVWLTIVNGEIVFGN